MNKKVTPFSTYFIILTLLTKIFKKKGIIYNVDLKFFFMVKSIDEK